MYLWTCLSGYWCTSSVYLCTFWFVYLCIYLCMSSYLCIFLSIYLSVCVFIYRSIFVSMYASHQQANQQTKNKHEHCNVCYAKQSVWCQTVFGTEDKWCWSITRGLVSAKKTVLYPSTCLLRYTPLAPKCKVEESWSCYLATKSTVFFAPPKARASHAQHCI